MKQEYFLFKTIPNSQRAGESTGEATRAEFADLHMGHFHEKEQSQMWRASTQRSGQQEDCISRFESVLWKQRCSLIPQVQCKARSWKSSSEDESGGAVNITRLIQLHRGSGRAEEKESSFTVRINSLAAHHPRAPQAKEKSFCSINVTQLIQFNY